MPNPPRRDEQVWVSRPGSLGERSIHVLQIPHMSRNRGMRECRRQGYAPAAHDSGELEIRRHRKRGAARTPQPAEADDREPQASQARALPMLATVPRRRHRNWCVAFILLSCDRGRGQ